MKSAFVTYSGNNVIHFDGQAAGYDAPSPLRSCPCVLLCAGIASTMAPESHYQEDFMLLADTLHASLVTCSGHDEQELAFQATGFIFSGHCSLFLSQRNKFP